MLSDGSRTKAKILLVVSTLLLVVSLFTLDYMRGTLSCYENYLTLRGKALGRLRELVKEKKNMEKVIEKFGIIRFPGPEKRFRALLALMDNIKEIDPNAEVNISPTPDYKTPLDRYTITVRTEAYSWDKVIPFIKAFYRSRYPLVEFNSLEITKETSTIKVRLKADVIMRFGQKQKEGEIQQ